MARHERALSPQQKEVLSSAERVSDVDLLAKEWGISRDLLRAVYRQLLTDTPPQDRVEALRERHHEAQERKTSRKAEKELLERTEALERELEALSSLKTPQTHTIKAAGKEKSESVAFVICSDWHYEEPVLPAVVSELNEFNLRIAKERINSLFANAAKLINKEGVDTEIKTVVLALLGDFITGSIHDELMESNQLSPTDAAWEVQNHIASGIDFLLAETDCNLVIPCHSGNHGRMTKKQRHATEAGNSLERYLYLNLAKFYAGNSRVTFMVAEGYHTYLDAFGFTVRFHHGHDIRYGGGVGGIYIPVNKAIAQWNKARRADLDVFGHFHQSKDGGNFICNGSLIGYNAYALSIKADYEEPTQTFFLVGRKGQKVRKTITAPIFLD